MPVYSKQCLVEIQEEMRALYTTEEIECIVSCLRGYKVKFSYQEIIERINKLYPGSRFAKETYNVLMDLYRIGIIGNSFDDKTTPQWSYKGQYTLLIDEPWKMIIHPALRIELSVSTRIDRQREKRDNAQQVYKATVKDIRYRYILVSFKKDGLVEEGYISINNLGVDGIQEGQIGLYYSEGETITVVMKNFNPAYSNWYMQVL